MERYGYDYLQQRARAMRRARAAQRRRAWFTFVLLTAAIVLLLVVSYKMTKQSLLSWSNCDHGETLSEFMENICRENVEICGEFSVNGEKLFERTDFSDSTVTVPTDWATLASLVAGGGVIHVHNHLDDAPFTYEDLLTITRINAHEAIVVTPHYIYSLRPYRDWPSEAEITHYMQPILDSWEDSAQRGLLQIAGIGDDRVKLSTDLLIEQFAREFQLYFRIKPHNS